VAVKGIKDPKDTQKYYFVYHSYTEFKISRFFFT